MLAINMAAVLREIYIAKDGVRRALGKERQRFLQRGGTLHVQLARSEPFEEQTAQAFFVVQHENRFAP